MTARAEQGISGITHTSVVSTSLHVRITSLWGALAINAQIQRGSLHLRRRRGHTSILRAGGACVVTTASLWAWNAGASVIRERVMGVETTPINLLHENRVGFCKDRQNYRRQVVSSVALWRIVCGVRVMRKVGSCWHATTSVLGSCAD